MNLGEECNCGNCTNAALTRGDNWLHAGVLCEGNEVLPDGVATIKLKGCLNHPLAREVVMAGVVEELELVRQITEKRYHAEITNMSERNYWKGKNNALFEVISLIRGGKE